MASFYNHAKSLNAMLWKWFMKQISLLYKKACDLFEWSRDATWMWEIDKSFSSLYPDVITEVKCLLTFVKEMD